MALFVIEAVRFNAERDRVEKVRWGKVRGGEVSSPVWADEPATADAPAVIDALRAGDEVLTVFTTDGGKVFGPKVYVVSYDDGSEGIEMDHSEIPARTLSDLPAF